MSLPSSARRRRAAAPLRRHHLLVAAALLACVAPAAAQERGAAPPAGVIAGEVVDSAGQPVAGAAVLLLGTQLRAVADSAGRFELRGVRPRGYVARVERVGYRTGTAAWEVGSDTLRVRVALAPDAVELEGITARSSRIESRLDTRLRGSRYAARSYGPELIARSVSANAADFVRWHASLALVPCPDPVVPDCVKKQGRVAHLDIYVDGVLLRGGTLELQARDIGEIARVEVSGGTVVRLYTWRYMQRAEEGNWRPSPER